MEIDKVQPPVPEDSELMETILVGILDHVHKQKKDAKEPVASTGKDVNGLIKDLQHRFKALDVMEFLARRLFRNEDDEMQTTGGKEKVTSASDSLSIIICLVSSDESTYLKAASRAVKAEALGLMSAESASSSLSLSNNLLMVMVAQLSGEDVEVSINAAESIVACCKKFGRATIEKAIQFIASSLKVAWDQIVHRTTDTATTLTRQEASTLSIRCASAIVDIVTEVVVVDDDVADFAMETAISCEVTNTILQMLTDGSDPLLQISTIDLIEQLSTRYPMNQARAKWLFSNPLLYPLLQMTGVGVTGSVEEGKEEQDYDPDPILGGPALRLLSSLCRLGQYDTELFQLAGTTLLTGFHRALHNFDYSTEIDRLAIIDAISSFASASSDALELILNDSHTKAAWLSLDVAKPKLKSAILTSVAMVIDPKTTTATVATNSINNTDGNSINNANTAQQLLKLYAMVGTMNNTSDTTKLLLSNAKSPIPENRLGAYSLLKAVAKLPTGAQILLTNHDFYQFLVTRDNRIENTKEGREAKFAIVETVINNEFVRNLLADEIVLELEKYIKLGPHYVQTQRYDLMTE